MERNNIVGTGSVLDVITGPLKYLDSIDLGDDIKNFRGKRIKELMDFIDEKYQYSDEFNEYLFSFIDEEIFRLYLEKRYKTEMKKIIIEYYEILW